MLECNINSDKDRVKVQFKGSGPDITLDVLVLVHEVWLGMKKTSPEAAEAFRKSIFLGITAPDSPLFEDRQDA